MKKNWFGLERSDATAPDIGILGIPYDQAVCYRRGAAKGPASLRRVSREIPPVIETGESLALLSVRDFGDVRLSGRPGRATPPKGYPRVISAAERILRGSFLLTLGGDHSATIPIHQALSRRAEGEIGIIFVDAHTDLSDRFNILNARPAREGSSYSHACPLRRALELPGYSPQRVVLVGTRCFEPPGLAYVEEQRIEMFTAAEISRRGADDVAAETVKLLLGIPNVYLSIDIDVLDPAYAPGTGIPEGGGLSTRELVTFIRGLDALNLVAADLVEVAPPLDISEITTFAGLKVIAEIFALVARRKGRGARTLLN